MITLRDYYLGRDITHGHLLGSDLRANAARTVEVANQLLQRAVAGGVTMDKNGRGHLVNSGWRPPDINARTRGAALRSLHMQCLAIDISDPDGDLDDWCLDNADTVLRALGLWLEHPAATKGWCHVQLQPPRSGRRVFYP
jgi:hypothetical protein